jgi:RNA polymerase sigma factor (sigma-70 family)
MTMATTPTMSSRPPPAEPDELAEDTDSDPGTETANDNTPPLTPEQRRLFDLGMPMMRQCTGEIGAQYHYPGRDLLGAGTLALFEVVRTYDAEQHPSFPVYARSHLRGRMIDAIKAEPSSKSARIERVMERAFEIVSSHHVVGANLFRDSEDRILEAARAGQTEVLAAAFLAGLLDRQKDDGEDGMIERLWLREGLDRLERREREVMHLVYREQKTLDEVAAALRITPKMAQKRHAAALRALHELLVDRRKKR